MRVEKRLSLEDSNKFIESLIESGNPFLISRIGLGGETIASVLTLNNQDIPSQALEWLHTNAGFYGTSEYYRFAKLYKDGFDNSDGSAYWNFPGFQQMEDYLIPQDKVLLDVSVLESFRLNEPWTRLLKGKKILIVHPFKKSIESQLENRRLIWENQDVLPEANYIVYQSVQSIGDTGPHRNWYESFDIMCDEISKINFDIAFLGCGAYGIPLANYIKTSLQKSAVYIGGGLQLYFGIMGKRWENSQDVTKFKNKYWIRPSLDETPEKNNLVESGCYW